MNYKHTPLLATTTHLARGPGTLKASRYDLDLKDLSDILCWVNAYCPDPDGTLCIKNREIILKKP